jgi:hypothetical protein
MCIDYEKLIEDLGDILEYTDYRPVELCEELLYRYGEYRSNITVYHGAFGHTENEVMENYSGLISCSYDISVAKSFAGVSIREDGSFTTIFEVHVDNVLCLDIQYLLCKCAENMPDNTYIRYLVDSYFDECEILLYFDDIKQDIKFMNRNEIELAIENINNKSIYECN